MALLFHKCCSASMYVAAYAIYVISLYFWICVLIIFVCALVCWFWPPKKVIVCIYMNMLTHTKAAFALLHTWLNLHRRYIRWCVMGDGLAPVYNCTWNIKYNICFRYTCAQPCMHTKPGANSTCNTARIESRSCAQSFAYSIMFFKQRILYTLMHVNWHMPTFTTTREWL